MICGDIWNLLDIVKIEGVCKDWPKSNRTNGPVERGTESDGSVSYPCTRKSHVRTQ